MTAFLALLAQASRVTWVRPDPRADRVTTVWTVCPVPLVYLAQTVFLVLRVRRVARATLARRAIEATLVYPASQAVLAFLACLA